MLVSAVLHNGLILDIAEPLSSSSLLLLCLVTSGFCFPESLLNLFLWYKPLRTGISSAISLCSGFVFYLAGSHNLHPLTLAGGDNYSSSYFP